jgi:peptidoglycan/LPS O-acetylase OafA/YrhL
VESHKRLDVLTSLRFFAAAMIVVHHSITNGLFGFEPSQDASSSWKQGVSFFFVLSGFILAHVYPKLETWHEIKLFWIARFARVWPAMVLTSLLAYYVLNFDWDWPVAFANGLMVHAWIPSPRFYFSYNVPSWSISTEAFFYLAFPLIISYSRKNWINLLAASSALLIAMFLLSNALQIQTVKPLFEGFTKTGLLYVNPLTRIFEFVAGVLLAKYWASRYGCNTWSKGRATMYEVLAVFITVVSIFALPMLGSAIEASLGERALSHWLSFAGSMFAFAGLIYTLAMQKGRISEWLRTPFLVRLGEISFSVYLLHQILQRYMHDHEKMLPKFGLVIEVLGFSLILLTASYLMWALVEIPARKMILKWGTTQKIHHPA